MESDTLPSSGMLGRDPALAEGYALLQSGDWPEAREYFAAASERGRTPLALEALGMAADLVNDETTAFAARTEAYGLFSAANDRRGAARVALWLTVDCVTFRGDFAIANGWLQRAHSLLEGVPSSSEHGWLALIESQKALLGENDAAACLSYATDALELGRLSGEVSLEAAALAMQGLSLVTAGSVAQGMSKLDEAATACLAGEVKDTWIISDVLCAMMDACDRARDWERAQQWFARVADFASRWKGGTLYAQCRPHYAVVLTWRGDWQEAEDQLRLSIEELTNGRKPMAVEGIVRLAELRWRQGRREEATALFDEVRHEPLSQVGLAAVALDEGDAAGALDLAELCLRRLPANDRLERVPALEMYVRACLALGDCDAAAEVLPELQEIASLVGTRPVRACARLAEGLLAAKREDYRGAAAGLQDAVDLLEQSAAPFEANRARLELAKAERALGRSVQADRHARSALQAFRTLGAVADAERAQAFLDGEPASQAHSGGANEVPDVLSRREVEVLRLLAAGMSNQEIAERLVLSVRTVQRHVENIYAKTGARGRAAAGVFAATHHLV